MRLHRHDTYVQGNPINSVDPSGQCPENPAWYDAFGWRCRFLAEGLAQRFSGGDQAAYNSWIGVLMQKSYGELELLTAGGSLVNVSSGAGQVLDNASILPGIFAENPGAALMALQQYTCQNQGSLGGLLGTLLLGTIRIPKVPGVGENVRIPGWVLPVAAGALTAWRAAYYWYKSKHPGLPDPIAPPMPHPAPVTPTLVPTATSSPKICNPQVFAAWAGALDKRNPTSNDEDYKYQRRVCGATEYHAVDSKGGNAIWADGIDVERCLLLESKHASDPNNSPWNPNSGPVHWQYQGEVTRYAAIALDPATPVIGLEVRSNAQSSAQYFANEMTAKGLIMGTSGFVDIRP